ncbi:Ig-like domain-containing protein, partial [uncultured Pseudoteredinibacter sp.]|uniref:Ig-like domain-containing protein n=1 Tax=uncultured Pseudoteredinibacter sp. TaxID=1641701 RepID=UPI002617576A
SAKVVDKAGNESNETDPLEFDIDTATPGAPSIVSVIDDVPAVAGGADETIAHNGITNDDRPTITGTGPKNATIRIYDGDPANGGTKLFETTSDGQGNWSYTPTAAEALADGDYN